MFYPKHCKSYSDSHFLKPEGRVGTLVSLKRGTGISLYTGFEFCE